MVMEDNPSELARQAAALDAARARHTQPLPQRGAILLFLERTFTALFPGHFPGDYASCGGAAAPDSTQGDLKHLSLTLDTALTPLVADAAARAVLCTTFLSSLPELYSLLHEDAQAICAGDPAAQSADEVILSYPGFYAIAVYRIAHWIHARGIRLLPRILTEFAHQRTGIDIHPGARIGRRFVIDHGTGIVVGETSHIHDDVKLYQGVTLGGLSVDKSMADTKRHPTIESNVVIYANATILGGTTVIGAGSVIGGNVWLTSSVPANSRVYHKAEFVIKSGAQE